MIATTMEGGATWGFSSAPAASPTAAQAADRKSVIGFMLDTRRAVTSRFARHTDPAAPIVGVSPQGFAWLRRVCFSSHALRHLHGIDVLNLRSLKLVRACRRQPDSRTRRPGHCRPASVRHELTAAPIRLLGFYLRKFGLVGITLRHSNTEWNKHRHHRRIGTIRGHALSSTGGRPADLPEPDNHYCDRTNDAAPNPRLNPRRNLHDCYSNVEEKSLLHIGHYGALDAGGSLGNYSGRP